MMKIITSLLICIVSFSYSYAKDITVFGKVLNKTSHEVINAASVKSKEQKKRVYTNLKGIFKLPLNSGNCTLEISALGYNSKTINIDNSYSGDTLLILLDVNPIITREAIAIGEIEPKDVIKRAIAKKQENSKRLRTVNALLYSKLYFDVNGSALNSVSSDSKSISVSAGSGEDKKPSTALMETFSKKYIDKKEGIDITEIMQRRQTANIPAGNNVISFTDFINLYDEEVNLIDVKLPTPLSSDALDFYNFSIISKTNSDDKIIYNIGLKPRNPKSPGFTGSISVIEGTYDLIEADLRPSEATAISFVDSLHYLQKFTNVADSVWYPTYLEVNFNAGVKIIEGLAEINFKAKAISIMNEIEVNKPLPDSVYKSKSKQMLKVASEADSIKPEFWENKALIALNDQEKQIYAEVDSLMSKIKKDSVEESSFSYSFSPYLNFNRVESASTGISPEINIMGIPISGKAFYSWGTRKFYGDFDITKQIRIADNFYGGLSVGAFSNIDRFSSDRSYSSLMNTISASLLHFDYYDYYSKSGFKASLFAKYPDYFDASITYENSRQSSLNTNTNKSIFTDKNWRINPCVISGDYKILFGKLKLGKMDDVNPTGDFDWELNINPFRGSSSSLSSNFQGVTADASINIPLFATGYKPIALILNGKGGISDNNLPAQYQFRMASSLAIYSKMDNILTAYPGEFGGMSYFEVLTELKLSDYLWREIGLPLFDERGLELSLFASFAKYYSNNNPIIYQATESKYYAEVGFGFFRIPLPKTNLIYWSFNTRFGVGELAKGRFKLCVGLELPF